MRLEKRNRRAEKSLGVNDCPLPGVTALSLSLLTFEHFFTELLCMGNMEYMSGLAL